MPGLPLFFRWSFLRMALGMKKLLSEWQVGGGREQGALDHVLRHAPKGNLDAAIAAVEYQNLIPDLMLVSTFRG